MKVLQILLVLVFGVLGSGSKMASEKDAPLVPFVTFSSADGAECELPLNEMKCLHWKQPLLRVQFRLNSAVLDLKGVLIYVPKEGDAVFHTFTDAASLTAAMQKGIAQREVKPGDRVIIDNLELLPEKKRFAPVIYTARD